MITFTLSGSLQQQIQKQLNNIFPNQLVSLQSISKKGLNYKDLVKLTNNQDITYLYGEMRDFEFIGISLQKDYNIDRTIYISDMTKELKNNQLEIGRNIKSDYEIILSKTTAVHLKQDYKKLLNRYIYGYYLQGDSVKKVRLKVVGISGENTIFDTIYINELANVKHVSECFNINLDQIYFSIGMINIDNKVNVNSSLKKLKKKYFNLEFKVAGENISNKINDFLLQTQRILILFSSLAVVAACFLIGEVLYLSVVQKTKDIGIFKCLGASKLQLKLLVLFESFILINIAFLVSYLSFCQFIGFINQFIEEGLQLNLSQSFIQIDNYLLGLIYFGALFFGIISSYLPARFASNLDPVKALKYQRY
ncbi:ABC transporter permease, partial [Thomasclavelia cocleata]